MGRYEQEVGQMFDFTRARILASVETSLQRLGLDCIDLVQASRQQHCCGEAWAGQYSAWGIATILSTRVL